MKPRRLKPSHKDFPDCLRKIHDPPQEIYVLGDLASALDKPRLAVVGSRKVTPYGIFVTKRLAGEAAQRGIVIVSGLAMGVDGLAHQAALDAQGLTVAVLGSGLDQFTPAANDWLARRILKQGGAIIGEYPPGSPVFKQNFIARNRLVAGLSNGVLIPEAAARSGSLHTAGFALDQGKTVMAVPGSINSSQSEGTNNLLKTSALTVTNIQDICLALGLTDTASQTQIPGLNQEESLLLQLLRDGATTSDQLLTASGMEPRLFNQTLTMLEISGLIYGLGGQHWALK